MNLRTGSTNLRRQPRHQEDQSCQPNPASSFELAAEIRKRPRVTFQPPSLFKPSGEGIVEISAVAELQEIQEAPVVFPRRFSTQET